MSCSEATSFGLWIGLEPLTSWLDDLVGAPVRIAVREWGEPPDGWISGVLHGVEIAEAPDQPPAPRLRLGVADRQMWVPLPPNGTASWECPRRQKLVVMDAGTHMVEIQRADPGTAVTDDLGQRLGRAFSDEDPCTRYAALGEVLGRARVSALHVDDDMTLTRVHGLISFLEGFR